MSDLTSDLLSRFEWLSHGFGTRTSLASQEGMASLEQIHSNRVLAADSPRLGRLGQGDALITTVTSVPISIRTADCLPILLVDSVTRSVAAIHAGWRGTASGIVTQVIVRMKEQFDSQPGNIYAAIGPGIGKCCFEVGSEVAREFGTPTGADGKAHVDLVEQNRRQLLSTGVPIPHIDCLARCTFCDAVSFHSYRRDGQTAGRMISWIARKAG